MIEPLEFEIILQNRLKYLAGFFNKCGPREDLDREYQQRFDEILWMILQLRKLRPEVKP